MRTFNKGKAGESKNKPTVSPVRSPEAAVPAGRRGAQPSAPGAPELPSLRPLPGDLGAGNGRPGGRQGRGRRTARLPTGQYG